MNGWPGSLVIWGWDLRDPKWPLKLAYELGIFFGKGMDFVLARNFERRKDDEFQSWPSLVWDSTSSSSAGMAWKVGGTPVLLVSSPVPFEVPKIFAGLQKRSQRFVSRIHQTEWVIKLSLGDNRPLVGSKIIMNHKHPHKKKHLDLFVVIQVIERPLMYEPRPSCCVHWNARHLSWRNNHLQLSLK